MTRPVVAMVLCLTLGAGGMSLASSFKVRLEPAAGNEPAPQSAMTAEKTAATPAEPAKLPGHTPRSSQAVTRCA